MISILLSILCAVYNLTYSPKNTEEFDIFYSTESDCPYGLRICDSAQCASHFFPDKCTPKGFDEEHTFTGN